MEQDYQKEIINLFRQFKLGNSLLKAHCIISTDMKMAVDKEDISNRIKDHLVKEISSYIVNQHASAITEVKKINDTQYNLELLVLKVNEFKTILEAAIQMIPDKKIQEIKNGKQL